MQVLASSTAGASYHRLSRLTAGVITYLSAMAAAEIVAFAVGPLQGAICLALIFITLLNLTILARLRDVDSAGQTWRLVAVAAIPPVEQLLMLSMPPMRWARLQEYVLWSLPLLVGVLVLFTTPLVAHGGDARPRLIRTRRGGYGLHGVSGQLLVALAGAGLGVVAGLLAEGQLRPIGELLRAAQPAWLGIVMVIFAGCSQELLYRGVIQPVATAAWDWVGVILSCMLMASAWLTWVGFGVAAPVIAASLLFGWAVRRSHALIGVLVGHGLFNLALALLWQRMLL